MKFCLGCLDDSHYEIVRATDTRGHEHTYSGSWPINPDALRALCAVARAAFVVQSSEDAGGNEWWEAHARLYLALDEFAPDCRSSVADEFHAGLTASRIGSDAR